MARALRLSASTWTRGWWAFLHPAASAALVSDRQTVMYLRWVVGLSAPCRLTRQCLSAPCSLGSPGQSAGCRKAHHPPRLDSCCRSAVLGLSPLEVPLHHPSYASRCSPTNAKPAPHQRPAGPRRTLLATPVPLFTLGCVCRPAQPFRTQRIKGAMPPSQPGEHAHTAMRSGGLHRLPALPPAPSSSGHPASQAVHTYHPQCAPGHSTPLAQDLQRHPHHTCATLACALPQHSSRAYGM